MSTSKPGAGRTGAPILVIEDEASVAAFLRTALSRRGYVVVSSESATDGLRLLKDGEFCGVISDVRTPGSMSGTDVHTWIREHRPDLLSRVIFITGDIANGQTAKLLEQSGVPFIEKPFRVAQLVAVLERTIETPREDDER
jgi:DNA-binding NtrC family response regulator